jgi:hypothetical protein
MGCEYVDDCGNETPCYETELQCKCNCPEDCRWSGDPRDGDRFGHQ